VVAVGTVTFFALALASAPSARAQQDSSGFPSIPFEYSTYQGQTTQLGCGGSDCPTVPTGATVDMRVWADLYNCDPVTIYFGAQGAGSQTVNFGGAFSMDSSYTYTAAGIYPVEAVMPTGPGEYTYTAPLTVGSVNTGPLGGGGFGGGACSAQDWAVAGGAVLLGLIGAGAAVASARAPIYARSHEGWTYKYDNGTGCRTDNPAPWGYSAPPQTLTTYARAADPGPATPPAPLLGPGSISGSSTVEGPVGAVFVGTPVASPPPNPPTAMHQAGPSCPVHHRPCLPAFEQLNGQPTVRWFCPLGGYYPWG
jgi:hypothetical protein